jgi:hypothetical protein
MKNPIAESCAILDVIENSGAGRNMIFRKCHFIAREAYPISGVFDNFSFELEKGYRRRKLFLTKKKLLAYYYSNLTIYMYKKV